MGVSVTFERVSLALAAGVLGIVSLAGCSSSPQVCGSLRPAVEEFQAADKAFGQSNKRKEDGRVYLDAQFKYKSVVAALAESSAAREAGLSSDLENFAANLGEDEDGAVVLVSLAAVNIERVCGFSPHGGAWYEEP